MLVLTRKVGEKIHVGGDVVITVVRIQNDKVRVGIEAPARVSVHREEVYQRTLLERQSHAAVGGDTPAP